VRPSFNTSFSPMVKSRFSIALRAAVRPVSYLLPRDRAGLLSTTVRLLSRSRGSSVDGRLAQISIISFDVLTFSTEPEDDGSAHGNFDIGPMAAIATSTPRRIPLCSPVSMIQVGACYTRREEELCAVSYSIVFTVGRIHSLSGRTPSYANFGLQSDERACRL
jgi:hypothetical protein